MAETEVLIIGGGLSGLSIASQLSDKNIEYIILEARDRFGGRILSSAYQGAVFDMGPAWYWPGQPRMSGLVEGLGLDVFDQHFIGDLIFEDESGQVHRGRGFASMQESYRLAGGFKALVEGLVKRVNPARLRLAAAVVDVTRTEDGVEVKTGDGRVFHAERLVIAVPPRVAAAFRFVPALPFETVEAMQSIATWMAGQAKAMALYETPFWREDGLSGDAMCRFGPLAEVHDASPATGGPYALFGFIGVPPEHRRDEERLRADVIAQLGRLFGDAAERPVSLMIKDWAFDPFTATPSDHAPLYAHPQYGLPKAMTGLWGGRIVFAGTEVANEFGGYLEGALEAAEAALNLIYSGK